MLQQKFPSAAKSFFVIDSFIKNPKQDFILVTSNEEEALQLYKQALFLLRIENILYFPSYDTIPYNHTSPSPNNPNLLDIVKIKLLCFKLNIESLDSGDNGFVIKFYKNADMADKVLKFVNTYHNQAKIKPDNKLVFVKKFVGKNIIIETNQLHWNLSEV